MVTDGIRTMEGAIAAATSTMRQFFDPKLAADKQIPLELMSNARGLAFLTVVKAGFIWTGKVGTGLVIAKLPDGRWSGPSAIGTAGMGFGAELGAEVINFMIILSSDAAVKSFKQKGQLSGGLNMEFAAGPYGRAAGANASISAAGVTPNYTYSHSKGLFGGMGLQGSAIAARSDLNKSFYGREITPAEILNGAVDQPSAGADLYQALAQSGIVLRRSTIHKSSRKEKMPIPASESDIQNVYDKVMAIIQATSGKDAVTTFKTKCKSYGQNEITSSAFVAYLKKNFHSAQLIQIIPDVVKLLQQHEKREVLWELYLNMKSEAAEQQTAQQPTPSLF